MRYSLAGADALTVWLALRDASVARLAEVERAAPEYLGEDVEQIGREELIERLRHGDVVLVDVRPSEEFAAGHIDGARSIPMDELHVGPHEVGTRVAFGTPARQLRKLADSERACMIVVGARRHSRLREALGRSPTARLLRRARRPVMVCPRPDLALAAERTGMHATALKP